MEQFLQGKPLVYTGFDGKLYVATYLNSERSGIGVGHLKVTNGIGNIVYDPLMSQDAARTFLWNVDATEDAV